MSGETRTSWLMLGAATVAVGVEAASNAMFAYDLGVWAVPAGGVTIRADGALLASASVAIAVMQAHSATAIVHHKQPAFSLAGGMLAVGLALSVGSMSAHMLKLQQHSMERAAAVVAKYEGVAGALRTAQAAYDRAKSEDEAARGRLSNLGAVRSVDAIDADINAARPDANAWRATKECTTLLHVASLAAACGRVLDLRAERAAVTDRAAVAQAAAIAGARLTTAREELDAANAKLADTPRPETPWPVRSFLAQALPWLMATAVITLSTFGFARAVRPVAPLAPAGPTPPAGTQVPPPRPARTSRPSSLATLLESLSSGSATVPGCSVDAEGWVDASQRQLAKALGLSNATVSRQLGVLRAQNSVATKIDNGRELIKWVKA